jgi:hypothetical protein
MTQFIRAASPKWFFMNLTGQPFDDTYYMFTLTNDLPYIPQAVYQDPNGTVPWSDPIEFQPSSGLPDNIYWDDTLTYRLEFRQGPSQTDPLIWLVQDFQPGAGSGGTIVTDLLTVAENQITNPQFADIYFTSPYTLTEASPGTYTIHVGPGWDLVLTGTGTTILTQGTNPGDSDIQGNPAYFLTINNSGWTSAQLIQKFSNNGAIFSGGAVAVAFTANATSSPETVTVAYTPSMGAATNIFSGSIPVGSMMPYAGAINIPASTSTDVDGAAYVNIVFNLPGTGIVSLSNIQLTGQSLPLSGTFVQTDSPIYQEETYERMVDHEFNVYKNSIILQPKDSVLVGWNFSQNPWQNFLTSGQTVTTNQYTADQTIVIQQRYVASATGSNVSVAQGSAGNNFCYTVTALAAHNQFAIVQYIDPFSIMPYWGLKMSALVKAFLNTTHSSTVKIKMRLFFSVSLPASTSQHVPVDSWTEGGDPVFAGGTTGFAPINDPAYTLGTSSMEFAFDGFQMPSNSAATQTLGVMVYTVGLMNQNATADSIVFQDVSLVPNDFAIASNPKSFDETLRECQFYFETSYAPFVKPGTVAVTGYSFTQNLLFVSGGSPANQWNMFPTPFSLVFETKKRAVPSVFTAFSPSAGTSDRVDAAEFQGSATATNAAVAAFSTNFDISNLTVRGLIALPKTENILVQTTGMSTDNYRVGIVSLHWAANSQLGV